MKIHDNSVPIQLTYQDAAGVVRADGNVELYLTHLAGGGQSSEIVAVLFTLLDKNNRDLLDELKKRFDEHMAIFAKEREGH